jgi:polar amino acid transport system substrate-binding protein
MTFLTRNQWILLIGGIALLFAACLISYFFILPAIQPQTPAPTQPPLSTPAPPQAACGNRWPVVQAAGRLVVGVSADYPPFESYNAQYQIDGFDIALVRLIGQQLGLQVDFVDFAFEGLAAALQLGQIDAAISAISITPERQSQVDFSDIYYYGFDATLARQDTPIGLITSVDQMAAYRVGAQAGTVYYNYLKQNLVDTGKMPAANLYSYARVDQAINDLKSGLIELVMLDLQPAQSIAASGGVKIVGEGFNTQSYAIAVCKGGLDLLERINQALTDLVAQGRVNELAIQYLNQAPDVTPIPTPTPLPPQPTPTPLPPPPCVAGLEFVADLNLPDNNMKNPPKLSPGQPFIKGWRVRNTGTCDWTPTYSLDYAYGNDPAARMGGVRTYLDRNVPPGGTYDLYVNLVAPVVPGVYQGFWQMLSSISYPFGQKVWVGIEVVPYPTATPKATQTPSPSIGFSAVPTRVNAGDPVTFNWNVQGAQDVYFYAQGEPWQNNRVAPQGSRVVYPPKTTTYELRVVWPGGTVEVRQIYIEVLPPPPGAPQIRQFAVNPTQITVGQCVALQWLVEGQVINIRLLRDGVQIWGDAPLSGTHQDCPPQPGQVTYAVEASGPGGTNRQQLSILVQAQPTVIPPTVTQPPPPPEILAFVVDPLQIQLGQFVNLSWSTGGTVDNVRITRDGAVILDGASLTGSAQDSPPAPGQVVYQITASNNAGLSDTESATLTVQQQTPSDPLEGTSWNLLNYSNGSGGTLQVLAGSEITLAFQPGMNVTGSAGCNTYNGPYQVQDGQLLFGSLATTGLACSDPPGVMQQEDAYLTLLMSTTAYQMQANMLQLYDAQGRVVLEFTLAIQPR